MNDKISVVDIMELYSPRIEEIMMSQQEKQFAYMLLDMYAAIRVSNSTVEGENAAFKLLANYMFEIDLRRGNTDA